MCNLSSFQIDHDFPKHSCGVYCTLCSYVVFFLVAQLRLASCHAASRHLDSVLVSLNVAHLGASHCSMFSEVMHLHILW